MIAAALFAFVLAVQPAPMKLQRSTDMITDDVRAFAVLRQGRNALAVGCDNAKTEGVFVVLNTDRWLQEPRVASTKTIVHRFDQGAAESHGWNINGLQVAEIFDRKAVAGMVRGLLASERVAIRAEGVSPPEIDLVFPIAGAEPVIREMLTACADEKLNRLIGPN